MPIGDTISYRNSAIVGNIESRLTYFEIYTSVMEMKPWFYNNEMNGFFRVFSKYRLNIPVGNIFMTWMYNILKIAIFFLLVKPVHLNQHLVQQFKKENHKYGYGIKYAYLQ